MLVDSHAHLDMSQFADDLDEVVRRAEAAGVGEMLNVGYDVDSLARTVALTGRFGSVYGACGIHPHNAKDWCEAIGEQLEELIRCEKVLAVGEIGLDYYRDLSPRDVQREVFRRQIRIALSHGKPIVVHSREAYGDVVRILREEGAGSVGGVFHAFAGGAGEAREVRELGFMIGIGGPLTYRNSTVARLAPGLPVSSLLLETDCPYLPPAPYRGKRNEPAYVAIVAERLAEIIGVYPADIERAVEVNYRMLFHRAGPPPPSIAYAIRGSVYLNVTSTCTNNCLFCPRPRAPNLLYGYNLSLDGDPAADELVSAGRNLIGSVGCGEVVFCGYGEPTARLDVVIAAAGLLRGAGLPLRINTNGQGNLMHGRNIVPELEGVFDRVSVSLNAPDRDSYVKLCRPVRGGAAFDAVVDFIRKAAASRMECVVTAVDCPGADLDACRRLVDSIRGAAFRVRVHRATA